MRRVEWSPARLKRAMASKWTVLSLAKQFAELGQSLSERTIRGWIAGTSSPSSENLFVLSAILGVEMRDFFRPSRAPRTETTQ